MPNPVVHFEIVGDDAPKMQAYLAKAEKLGGKTIMPPTVIPDMVTMAMFTDPAGNVIGLTKSGGPQG